MLYTKLRDELAILSAAVIDDGLLLYSTNRALRDLYTTRRILRTVRIATKGLTPITRYEELDCSGGGQVTFPLHGLSYSMRVHGIGQYMIKDGQSTKVYSVDSPDSSQLIKGFVLNGGSITFWSSYNFIVYDLCMYDRLFSERLEDIPDGGDSVVIDLRKRYGDFMSFVSQPRGNDGRIIEGCKLYDGRIEVDVGFKGEILLTYRRLPRAATGYENDEIDLPEEYSHIFPLLVAFYSMLDIDEGRAKYYKGLYEDAIRRIDEGCYSEIDPSYVITDGWA